MDVSEIVDALALAGVAVALIGAAVFNLLWLYALFRSLRGTL